MYTYIIQSSIAFMGLDLKPAAPGFFSKAGPRLSPGAKSLQSLHIHGELDRICCRFGAQVIETGLQPSEQLPVFPKVFSLETVQGITKMCQASFC